MLNISYSPEENTHIEINGIKYSEDLFENLKIVTPEDHALRIVRVDDGVVTAEIKMVPAGFWEEKANA